ncbi:MAG TPA: 16S rRNA (uracil(1498)-N(3))-methyltransferase [Bacteroidales bacterium]|nr:16S rRNA (uracil(1498)-N(3))-methyltransferase [Bacteroidales bacterium]
MHLFYAPHIEPEYHVLSREESMHCRVLRIRTGDFIYITDGKGMMCKTIVTDNSTGIFHTKIVDQQHGFNKLPYHLHIAIAPTKNTERFEWFLEKATELGIAEITPLLCVRSEKIRLKYERLQKVLISAIKQSFTAYLPKFNTAIPFSDFLKNDLPGQKFIAYCGDNQQHLNTACTAKNDVTILIGPEGDFTAEEISLSEKHGFLPITLGKNRLRTETAGIFACSVVNTLNIY